MPLLATKFTVIAVDLRGFGNSAPAVNGYEAANLAEDIHQLIAQLRLDHVYLVGHDVGGMVAYAFARRYSETARGVMILDVAFPGLDPWEDFLGDRFFWHIRFHQTDLPEQLVVGCQALYFRYFLGSDTFTDENVAHFAHSYRDPDHLSAADGTYCAFPANASFFAGQRSTLVLPIVYGVGEHDAFASYLPRIAEAMRAHGCANLKTEILKGAIHYVADERPDLVTNLN